MSKSSLIIKHLPGFGGNFIDSQYLGNSYETGNPYVFQDVLTQAFSSTSQMIKGKLLTNTLSNMANGVKEIDSSVYRWRLQGAEEKSMRVLETIETSTTPGLNNTPFRVKVDLNLVAYPDVVLPENNEFPCQVIDVLPDGTGYILTLKLQSDNPAAYLNPAYLEVGKEFSRVWASTPEEFNDVYGTQQYASSYMLEHQLGSFAQKITVTDKAWREQGKMAFKFNHTDRNGNTKSVDKFLPYAEAQMWD